MLGINAATIIVAQAILNVLLLAALLGTNPESARGIATKVRRGIPVRDEYRLGWLGLSALMTSVFAALAYGAWIAGNGAGHEVANPAFAIFASGALGSLYLAVAPLTHRWPYQTSKILASPTAVLAIEKKPSAEQVEVERTPQELWALFDGLTDLQAQPVVDGFVGGYLTIAGIIDSIGEWNDGGGGFSRVMLRSPKPLSLMFEDESWVRSHLFGMSIGDSITARGRIETLSRSALQLAECKRIVQ